MALEPARRPLRVLRTAIRPNSRAPLRLRLRHVVFFNRSFITVQNSNFTRASHTRSRGKSGYGVNELIR